jgi:hypothetical protein
MSINVTSHLPMNMNLYDHIYIRTSLNTNFWDETGTAQDVMEIIPVATGQAELGQEYKQITRIYQVKDPNVKTFQVRFTDSKNKPVVFKDPYILQLAVFFKN